MSQTNNNQPRRDTLTRAQANQSAFRPPPRTTSHDDERRRRAPAAYAHEIDDVLAEARQFQALMRSKDEQIELLRKLGAIKDRALDDAVELCNCVGRLVPRELLVGVKVPVAREELIRRAARSLDDEAG